MWLPPFFLRSFRLLLDPRLLPRVRRRLDLRFNCETSLITSPSSLQRILNRPGPLQPLSSDLSLSFLRPLFLFLFLPLLGLFGDSVGLGPFITTPDGGAGVTTFTGRVVSPGGGNCVTGSSAGRGVNCANE